MATVDEAFAEFKFKPGDVVLLRGDAGGVARLTVTAQALMRYGDGCHERCYRCIGIARDDGRAALVLHRQDYSESELMAAPAIPDALDTLDAVADLRDQLDRWTREIKAMRGGGK